MSAAQARVAALLREEGGLLAAAASRDLGAAGAPDPRAVALAAVREGHVLHAPGGGAGAIVATGDPDLALLAGDRLYALGLAELARAADLEAVRILATVIASSAAARGAGDDEGAERAWEQGFRLLAHRPEPPAAADR